MAVLTAGSFLDFDNLDFPFSFLTVLSFTERRTDFAGGDYRAVGVPELGTELSGSGFRYDQDGALVRGTVEGIHVTAFGETLFRLQDLSVGVPRLADIAFLGEDSGWAAVLAGDDTIIGSPLDDHLRGYGGDDRLTGGPGNDIIDGGGGFDRAVVVGDGPPGDTMVVVWNGLAATVPAAGKAGAIAGVDKLVGIEAVLFQRADGSVVATQAIAGDNFAPLPYIASYSDLADAFGTNAAAGFDHYIYSGLAEGRRPSFDPTAYLAANPDVLAAFGADRDAAAAHFITNGRFEGRGTVFDGLQYIASHGDLIVAFGPDAAAGTAHFVAAGFAEGRAADSFDAAQYLANHADLRAAFGSDETAATLHFISNGFAEGRTDDRPAATGDFLL